MHEVDATHRSGLYATTGFFDVKGGFDNVSHPIRLERLSLLGTPSYLVSWSKPFLSGRPIALVYPGAPNLSVPVSVGAPQGSPISPLFFIYAVPYMRLMAYSLVHRPLASGVHLLPQRVEFSTLEHLLTSNYNLHSRVASNQA